MKLALVHDAVVNRGGAERVFQVFCETFPTADIYTSVYHPERTFSFFKQKDIRTTFLQNIVSSEKMLKVLFPLANSAMSSLDLREYEVVLSSSTFCAKYVNAEGRNHICYCYTPFRLIWNADSYCNNRVVLNAAKPVLSFFRKWDFNAAQRVNKFLAMTEETSRRILLAYQKRAEILPPPIDCETYRPGNVTEDFFLIVSRLESYKRVDFAIGAFNRLGRRLLIVGSGRLQERLKKIAGRNIEFLGQVSDETLRELYGACRAVVFPQYEDFGLVPLEANASGKPVICFGKGGVQTTMIPYDEKNRNIATAIFFDEQMESSLIAAIKRFDESKFSVDALVANAKRFDKAVFQERLKEIVREK